MGLWDRFAGKSDLDEEPSGPSRAENLRVAAGISTTQMRCHQDTRASRSPRRAAPSGNSHVFRPAAEEEIAREVGGMVVAPISGSSLAAPLVRCF